LRTLVVILLLNVSASGCLFAQKENQLIRSGNRLYKQGKFDQSQTEYQKALGVSPTNPAANYNLGNTEFRKSNFDEAAKSFETTVENTKDSTTQQKGLYNKGVALIKQQKLDESIEAWKNALKLDPSDVETRENLQKALLEKKKQSKQKENKDQKQQQQQKQDDQKEQKPKQQQSKLTKQQVEQYLKSLAEKEKEVQDKMNQNKTRALSQPDKDW